MSKKLSFMAISLMAFALMIMTGTAFADGAPQDWGINLQPAASPVMERIHDFHNLLFILMTAVCVFVLALLVIIVVRFNSHANKEPANFSHNTLIEIIWTVVPVVILVVISVPSMKLLYYQNRVEEPEMTIKAMGYQWYWGYEYPDHEGMTFLSYMIPDDEIDASKGQKRLLSTDNPVVLPTETNIQVLVTAADVLHSFAVPSLGIKTDSIPGRLNETWVRINKPGIYYGQCSELCGKGHAYMPIEIHAVPKEEFNAWVEEAKKEYVSYPEYKQRVQLAKAEEL